MTTLTSKPGHQLKVDFHGMIDEGQARQVRLLKEELAGKCPQTVVFDFSQVTFIGSSGLGSLIQLYKAVAAQGGKVCLNNVPKNIYEMFRVVQLDKVFQMALER